MEMSDSEVVHCSDWMYLIAKRTDVDGQRSFAAVNNGPTGSRRQASSRHSSI